MMDHKIQGGFRASKGGVPFWSFVGIFATGAAVGVCVGNDKIRSKIKAKVSEATARAKKVVHKISEK